MKEFFLILFFIPLTNLFAQSKESHKIKISILSDTVFTAHDNPKITFSFASKNESNVNLLVYGIGGNINMLAGKSELLCDQDKVSAGLSVFIYNNSHDQKYPVHFSHGEDLSAMTTERLDSIMKKSKREFVTKTRVLKPNDTANFACSINLKDYRLEKGKYFLNIVYFSGNQLRKLVDKNQIVNDMRIYDAEPYNGCSTSNTILLRVY